MNKNNEKAAAVSKIVIGGILMEKSEYAVTPLKLNEMPKTN